MTPLPAPKRDDPPPRWPDDGPPTRAEFIEASAVALLAILVAFGVGLVIGIAIGGN